MDMLICMINMRQELAAKQHRPLDNRVFCISYLIWEDHKRKTYSERTNGTASWCAVSCSFDIMHYCGGLPALLAR